MKNQVRIVISYGKLRKRMMNDPYNYTEREVAHTVWRLLNVSAEIQSAFVAWFEHGIANIKLFWNKLFRYYGE